MKFSHARYELSPCEIQTELQNERNPRGRADPTTPEDAPMRDCCTSNSRLRLGRTPTRTRLRSTSFKLRRAARIRCGFRLSQSSNPRVVVLHKRPHRQLQWLWIAFQNALLSPSMPCLAGIQPPYGRRAPARQSPPPSPRRAYCYSFHYCRIAPRPSSVTSQYQRILATPAQGMRALQ